MALSAGSRSGVPGFKADGAMHRRELVTYLEQVQIGHIACTGEVTLNANSSTTTVTDSRVGPKSAIILCPLTQNASSEVSGGPFYISSRGKQTFTITHRNTAAVDKTFTYAVLG